MWNNAGKCGKEVSVELAARDDRFMPLTQRVRFQCQIERCNMVLVPKIIRWQFKMETDQVLKVGISTPGTGIGIEWFYAKMKKEGRIRVPKLIVMKLESGKSLLGYILEVTLEPV